MILGASGELVTEQQLSTQNNTAHASAGRHRRKTRPATKMFVACSVDRAVYAAFLNRAKEVGEQQDLNDTNSRIITRAVPPTAKSSPPRTLIMAGSFILGLIGGGMIGLLREQFNPTVISARELATDFRMRVLAELSDYADAPSPVFRSETPQAEAMHRLLGFCGHEAARQALT